MPPAPPDFLRPLLARPVAIFGAGVSGQGVRALLAKLGSPDSVIYDAKTPPALEFTAKAAARHGLVVFSPGFAPDHPWLTLARAAGLECLGELDFASLFWRGQIVAVTGTNGKTTLTEFLTHALRATGHDARAVGNIGYPLSQFVAETDGGTLVAADKIAVCEVSSFQAETLRHLRADATLWTNFAEDHLERHPGLEAYFAAKWTLVACTAPGAFFAGSSVQRFAEKLRRPLPARAALATENQPRDLALADTLFATYPQRENFIVAAAWWQAAGLALADLYAAAHTFRLGRHRLARVATHRGVVYWNDSKATNFHAVEAALAGFDAPVLLIAGGKAKGGDIAAFAQRIATRTRHIFLIGETASELTAALAAAGAPHTLCASLSEAAARASALAVPGDQVLLSPGFASFDQFRNYEDRGNQFEQLVNETIRIAELSVSESRVGPS
jgi:UDP-N-acetylmuramoylalanine--D-glutamate ligase